MRRVAGLRAGLAVARFALVLGPLRFLGFRRGLEEIGADPVRLLLTAAGPDERLEGRTLQRLAMLGLVAMRVGIAQTMQRRRRAAMGTRIVGGLACQEVGQGSSTRSDRHTTRRN